MDSSSDDEVPLGQLMKRKNESPISSSKKSKPAAESSKPAPKPVSKPKAADSSTKVASKPASNSTPKSKPVALSSSSAAKAKPPTLKNDVDIFYETTKGLLVQKLICRWWYAVEWPSAQDLKKPAPVGYEPLDGYPGVFICVKGDSMGKLHDNRNAKTCPNLKNLMSKSSEELCSLLKVALESQKEKLIEAEGPSSPHEDSINKDLRWLSKVNAAKADKEFTRK